MAANFLLQAPINLRSFAISATSSSSNNNGSTPGLPQTGGPVVMELPLDKIRRPLMRTRSNDQQKVKELMDSISEIGLQVPREVYLHLTVDCSENFLLSTLDGQFCENDVKEAIICTPPVLPIDVLEVDGVYYGFSGCHRYEAHQRLGLPTIRCKVRRGTKETLRHHLR